MLKSILIFCLTFVFLGAQSKETDAPITAPSEPSQEQRSFDWKAFISVEFGAMLGVNNTYTDTDSLSGAPLKRGLKNYDKPYFGVDLGAEFIFKNGNGFNVVLNLDNQAEAIGANYVYELTGQYKFAFITGLDIGIQWLDSDYQRNWFASKIPLMRYNLGVRYRAKKHAISGIVKIPIYGNNLKFASAYYGPPIGSYNLKSYAGVSVLVAYSYFFKL